MRDIEFRAWDKVTKRYWHLNLSNMVFEYSKTGNGRHILRLSAIEAFNNSDRFVIEPYTGLKDKNGKKIFEVDILEIRSFYSEIYDYDNSKIIPAEAVKEFRKVVSDEGSFGIANGGHFFESLRNINKGRQTMLVVGNIHENPNLLGEEK